MKRTIIQRLVTLGCAALLAGSSAFAQEHKWAGRTLDDLESTIHARLEALPFHGVFDTLDFEVNGKTVTLSGRVVKDSIRQNAERSVRRLHGVDRVINHIEVLPYSRSDDALRMSVYRVIYQSEQARYSADGVPPIHIIVKNGFVTLEGVVDSEGDRGAALIKALGVTTHVSNNLRVARGE
jgi:hyperosmotically inducible protein